MSAFVFMYQHIELFIGGLITLILLVGIIFLWRMLNEKPQAKVTTLDLDQFEASLKRLMSQATVSGAAIAATLTPDGATASGTPGAGAVAGGQVDPAAMAKLQAILNDREKAIAELQAALAKAKEGGSTATGEHALALLEMQNKVRDLEARLAEYSIIEDDIADLSMYKEENLRLKKELQEVRGGAPAATAAPAATQAPAPKTPVEEFAATVSEQIVPKVETGKRVELDLGEDDNPLAGALDTSKMMEEVANLKQDDHEEDVLAGALDTDKLMSELGSFGNNVTPSGSSDRAPEEDLFGEFKDEEKQ